MNKTFALIILHLNNSPQTDFVEIFFFNVASEIGKVANIFLCQYIFDSNSFFPISYIQTHFIKLEQHIVSRVRYFKIEILLTADLFILITLSQ